MSRSIGFFYHPTNNHPVAVFEGFSWPCLLFGSFWYAYKGMWKWFIISFLIIIFTGGFAWLVLPFFANSQHQNTLKTQGYFDKKKDENSEESDSFKNENDNLDKLKKLSDLKDQGILTKEEFQSKKKDLLDKI